MSENEAMMCRAKLVQLNRVLGVDELDPRDVDHAQFLTAPRCYMWITKSGTHYALCQDVVAFQLREIVDGFELVRFEGGERTGRRLLAEKRFGDLWGKDGMAYPWTEDSTD